MAKGGDISLIAKIEFFDGRRDSIELSMEDAKDIAETLAEQEDQLKKIVRCKDCKWWDKDHSEECDNSDNVCFHNGWCKPDWFCADGEKKDWA